MRLRVRNLIIALSAAVCFAAVSAGTAAAASPPGTASVFAGGGNDEVSTAGTPATSALLFNAQGNYGLAVDAAGDTAVGDTANNVVDLMPGADCTTNCPFGLGPMKTGDLYAITGYGSTVPTPTGVPMAQASLGGGLNTNYGSGVQALGFDGAGDLIISVTNNSAPSEVYLLSGRDCSQSCPYGLASMKTGYVYLIAGGGGNTSSPFNAIPATQALLLQPGGVTVDSRQDILFTDAGREVVFLVAASACSSNCPLGVPSMVPGDIYTVAGNGTYGSSTSVQSATSSMLENPDGVAFDPSGNLFITQSGGKVDFVLGQSCSNTCPYGYTGTSFAANDLLQFQTMNSPQSVVIDPAGDVLISDLIGKYVEMYAAVNCSQDCPYGLASMTAGTTYNLANAPAAPTSMALSPSGTLYVFNSPYFTVGQGVVYQITGGAALFKLAVSGTGTVSGGGTSCQSSCTTVHAADSQLPLTATPGPGEVFVGWQGGGCTGVGTCDATVAAGATVTAMFKPAATLNLSVSGMGTVSAGGVSCQTSCTTTQAAGSQIVVKAKPAAGQVFVGWGGGGCKGVGACTTTVTAGTSVTAIFKTRTYLAKRLGFVLNKVAGKNMTPKLIWRHKGFLVAFKSAAARKLVIAWHIRRHHHNVLVAIGRVTPAYAGVSAKLKIKLTKAGRRLLSATTAFKGTEIARLYVGRHKKAITLKRRIKV